jgi:hypothetical protein
MAIKAKKKADLVSDDENDAAPVATKAASEDDKYDELTYIPEDGDPIRTRWNGIEFRAHVPVKVSRKQIILVPLRQETTLASGEVVTRAIERRVPMVELARGNSRFAVNGVPPQQRTSGAITTPETPDEYRGYCMRWIMASTAVSAMDSRWSMEEALRAKCGCDDKDIVYLRPIFEARVEALGGKTETGLLGGTGGMKETLAGLTPRELAMEASRRN